MGKADLHIHTTASDGKSSPSEIVQRAISQKLDLIAITDHDTIAGFTEARKIASDAEQQLKVWPGVEITAEFKGREAHLLAYCFDPRDDAFTRMLKDHKKARLKRGKWIVDELSKEGLEVNIEEVKAEARGSNIGRPHIASVLVGKGYVGSVQEAFIRYLSNHQLGSIPSVYYAHSAVIETVKQAGGAIVVAHPGNDYSIDELEYWVDSGIDGIETVHPSHNYDTQKRIEKFAKQHQLLTTGGSDFHGASEEYHKFFGVTTIPMRKAAAMKRMTDQRKEIILQ